MSILTSLLPQFDRGRVRTLNGFISEILKGEGVIQERAIPAIVLSCDNKSGTATVMPIVARVGDTKDGEVLVDRPSCTVKVVRIHHGGFKISIPVKRGDTGWLIASDRNASSAMSAAADHNANEEFKQMRPNDLSVSKFANGFFIPDNWSVDESAEDDVLSIESEDGKRRIRISGSSIEINNGDSSAKVKSSSISASTKTASVVVGDGSASMNVGKSIVRVTGSDISIDGSNGGASITESATSIRFGDESLRISKDGIRHTGPTDRIFNIVTDMRYDKQTHQMQKRVVLAKQRGDLIVMIGKMSDWVAIDGGQAVPEYKP